LTDDDELLALLKSVRVHGGCTDKYDNVRIGLTARLDTIQAAVLIEKLRIFPDEIDARNRIASRYSRALADVAIVPTVPKDYLSVWAQYTLRLKPGQRDPFVKALAAEGIPTACYYPKPLHRQTAYSHYPVAEGGVPATDRLAEEVISLPMHAYLDEPTQDRVIDAVRRALGK
jgi:dTDP-4-amino-4,6-dideoxygalactose transaminase